MRALVAVGMVAFAAVAAPSGIAAERAVSPCATIVREDVLPVWMRAGFQTKSPRIPHVVGRSGQIGGVLFGWPLMSPPAAARDNKILWVSRRPSSRAALWIRMQRMEGTASVGAPVRKIISGGPGPSIVDVPSPGCWRLTLTWSGRRDTLDLRYG